MAEGIKNPFHGYYRLKDVLKPSDKITAVWMKDRVQYIKNTFSLSGKAGDLVLVGIDSKVCFVAISVATAGVEEVELC